MSDKDEEQDERGNSTGHRGRYTGDDLARDVQLDAAVASMSAGELLNDVDAEKVLRERMDESGLFVYGGESLELKGDMRRGMIEVIIDSLPKELRTKRMLDNLDLRPYLEALNGKKVKLRSGGLLGGTSTSDVLVLDGVLAGENERIINQIDESLINQGYTTEKRRAMAEQEASYDPLRVGLLPTGIDTPSAGQPYVEGEGGVIDENGEFVADGGPTSGPVKFPVAEMRQFIQTHGVAGLEMLVDQEAAYADQLGGGFFPVETTEETTVWSDTSSSRGTPIKAETMNVAQARNMLASMTPTEVADTQRKLAAAGYFDQVDGGAGYVEGDAFDPATREAWDLMLVESMQTQTAIPTLVGQKARTYRDEVRRSRMAALADSDPRMTKLIADDWAMATIGRKLKQEEADELHRYMMELTRKRSTFVAGATGNESDEGLQGDYGFTPDDIQLQLSDQFGREELDTLQGERYFALNKYVGG